MSALLLEGAALGVLGRYPPPLCRGGLTSLGNRGGFSGARLWRVDGPCGGLCLRAWPAGDLSPQRLTAIHHLMTVARQIGLDFVPVVYRTRAGLTWEDQAGRLWDLTTWMPGRADFHARPTASRLQTACAALAQLHGAWSGADPTTGPSPALARRLELVREWAATVTSGWQPRFGVASEDPVRPWAERAWRVLPLHLARMRLLLEPLVERTWPLQPCLGDVWHDHLLFEGDKLTGLIDYGGIKRDHVAVDLARMLGSLVGNDGRLRAVGLEAYTRLRPLTEHEQGLVPVLDESGTLLGAGNWLKWLYREGRVFDDRAAVAKRLAELVGRIEGWK